MMHGPINIRFTYKVYRTFVVYIWLSLVESNRHSNLSHFCQTSSTYWRYKKTCSKRILDIKYLFDITALGSHVLENYKLKNKCENIYKF